MYGSSFILLNGLSLLLIAHVAPPSPSHIPNDSSPVGEVINIRIPARNTGSNGKSGNPWLFLSLLKLISLGEVVVDDKVLSSDLTLFFDGPSDSDVDLSCSLRLSDADVGPCLLLLGLLRLRYWRRLIRLLSLDRPVTDNLAGSGTFGRAEGQAPDGGDAGEAIFDRLKRSYGRFPVEYANTLGEDSIEASKNRLDVRWAGLSKALAEIIGR